MSASITFTSNAANSSSQPTSPSCSDLLAKTHSVTISSLYKDVLNHTFKFLTPRECALAKSISKQFFKMPLTNHPGFTSISPSENGFSLSFREDAFQREFLLSKKNLISMLKTATAFGCIVKSLDLSYLALDDQDLEGILNYCPHLLNLQISESLILKDCYQMTDVGLVALGNSCSKLQILDLSSRRQITYDGLVAIGLECHDLHTLSLSFCNQITDEEIIELGQFFTNLHTLDLTGRSKITGAKILALGKGYPNLQTLDLRFSNQITDEEIIVIDKSCPHLKIIK